MAHPKNKKANIAFSTVTIFITIIGFFTYLGFFSNIAGTVVSESDDLLCRTFIAAKETTKLGMGVFFWELNNKCKIDEIGKVDKIDLKDENEAFEIMADEMKRCWYRYGEGNYDFLSEWDTEGNWCFICGTVAFEDGSGSREYKEFVEWTKENSFKLKNGTKMPYYDYINIKYTDINDEESREIRKEYEELLNGDIDAQMKPMLYVLAEQINALDDLRFKTIDSSDKKIYVVYRFDRVNKTPDQKMEAAKEAAKEGTLFGIAATIGAEMAIEAAVMGTGGAVVGSIVPVAGNIAGGTIGTVVGALKGVVQGVYKVVTKGAEAVKKLMKVSTLMKKIQKFTKHSVLTKTDDVVKITVGKGSYKAFNKIKDFDASVKDLRKFAEGVSDPKVKSKFNSIADMMDNVGVKNLKDFDKVSIKNKAKSNELESLLKDADADSIFNNELFLEWEKLGKNREELENIRKLALDEVADLKSGADVKLSATGYWIKLGVLTGIGGLGAYVLSTTNDNNIQYVDLLTREQYYRLCGTQRFADD